MKNNWIGHKLRRNCLLTHRIEGQKDEEQDVRSFWLTLGKETILELETGSTISHSVENSLWKIVWNCRKTVYMMMMMMMVI